MTTKQIPITEIPFADTTDECYTFGTINICRDLDVSEVYEIGEIAKNASGQKYRFKKHHDSNIPFDDTYYTAITADTESVKADLSFISRGVEFISRELTGGNYAFSLNNLEKYKDYTFRVSAYNNDSFNVAGIFIYGESMDGTHKVRGKTDSSGICKLTFIRDKTYSVWSEKKEGYISTSNSGEKYILTPKTLNFYEIPPSNFIENWQYHVGERVSHDGCPYSFTSEHSGAWNESHVQSIDIRKNIVDFVYTKTNDRGDVNLKIHVQHRGGIPYSNFGPISVFSDENMAEWRSGSADLSGDFECSFPKNVGCHITSVTANWSADFNLPEPVTTVTDDDKTINYTYDSGLYWVCGETTASIADGTANKEFLLDDFPHDDPSTWQLTSFYNQTTKKTETCYMPVHHPCVLLHVATPELVARKFDHRSMTLSGPNEMVATSSYQEFPQKDYKYDASYYVRLQDLSTQRSAEVMQGRRWCSQNLLHEHVTTSRDPSVLSSYDGPLMTSWCKWDSENNLKDTDSNFVAASSQAANYALSSEFLLGDRTLHGFIGTYMQMNPLFMLSDAIYYGMSKFGYVGNYKTGTYWWSVTQDAKNDRAFDFNTKITIPIWGNYYKNSKFSQNLFLV